MLSMFPPQGSSADEITNTPAGNISATNVQSAINELDSEKAALAGNSSQVFSVGAPTAIAHALRADSVNGFIIQLSANTTLTTAHANGVVTLNNTSAFTLTLPSVSSFAGWASLTLVNMGTAAVTVNRAGSDMIYAHGLVSATTMTIGAGESIHLIAVGALWIARGYSQNTEPIDYATTLSAGVGTFTTASATMKIIKQGRKRSVFFTVTITTNGTAADSVILTLPEASAIASSGVFRENAVTGNQGQAFIHPGGSSISLWTSTNTYPGASGYIIYGSIEYYV